jgi:hypothetical protein
MLHKLVPSVADALDAATEPAVAVQYNADELPGVGYALYTLLPLLDHSSAMLKAGQDYSTVPRLTLTAIQKCLGVESTKG